MFKFDFRRKQGRLEIKRNTFNDCLLTGILIEIHTLKSLWPISHCFHHSAKFTSDNKAFCEHIVLKCADII